MTFKDYFSTQSNDYANYRPRYPRELAAELAKCCVNTEIALDCGCGTGQLSVLLANYFHKVIATDASRQQIENAEIHPRVTYKITTAENSQLTEKSVDIITVAQAAHWLDLDRFYAEARRISKPAGIIALITYGILFVDDKRCNSIVHDFYHNVLGAHWPPERRHVESGYKTLAFPFQELPFPAMEMHASWNFHQLFGYLTTWSAFKAFKKTDKFQGIIEVFHRDLSASWMDLDAPKTIAWPLSGRIGKI